MTIETERLALRPLAADDAGPFAAMMADPEVMRYLGGPKSVAEAWRSLAFLVGHRALRGFGMYAVVERATGAFCGRAGFHEPEGWPGFELGWALARNCWGRGYATEAGRALLAHALGPLGRDRVISLIRPENDRSARVAARLGMVREGQTEVLAATADVWAAERPTA